MKNNTTSSRLTPLKDQKSQQIALAKQIKEQELEPINFLTLQSLETRFNALAKQSGLIDHFCSSSYWAFSALEAFQESPVVTRCFQNDHGIVALSQTTAQSGQRIWHALEPAWLLAAPLVGDAPLLTRDFFKLCQHRDAEWDLLLLSGFHPNSQWLQEIVRHFAGHYRIELRDLVRRHRVTLPKTIEDFLAVRSHNFKRSVARSQRRALEKNISIQAAPTDITATSAFKQILDIEEKSWKAIGDNGISTGPMKDFYSAMIKRLVRDSKLKLLWAIDNDTSKYIGYILGAVFGDGYRGLQFSFDQQYHQYSIGNLLQIEQIKRLLGTEITSYDLGTEMPYKHRWSNQTFDTVVITIRKS